MCSLRGVRWLGRMAWRARADLLRARARVDKLSFFIHNFMDACSPEKERIDACVFTAATADGPVSMCLHNTRRDDFILQPLKIAGDRFWDPLSGETSRRPIPIRPAFDRGEKRAKERLKRTMTEEAPAER
jgi:hypothetical protein